MSHANAAPTATSASATPPAPAVVGGHAPSFSSAHLPSTSSSLATPLSSSSSSPPLEATATSAEAASGERVQPHTHRPSTNVDVLDSRGASSITGINKAARPNTSASSSNTSELSSALRADLAPQSGPSLGAKHNFYPQQSAVAATTTQETHSPATLTTAADRTSGSSISAHSPGRAGVPSSASKLAAPSLGSVPCSRSVSASSSRSTSSTHSSNTNTTHTTTATGMPTTTTTTTFARKQSIARSEASAKMKATLSASTEKVAAQRRPSAPSATSIPRPQNGSATPIPATASAGQSSIASSATKTGARAGPAVSTAAGQLPLEQSVSIPLTSTSAPASTSISTTASSAPSPSIPPAAQFSTAASNDAATPRASAMGSVMPERSASMSSVMPPPAMVHATHSVAGSPNSRFRSHTSVPNPNNGHNYGSPQTHGVVHAHAHTHAHGHGQGLGPQTHHPYGNGHVGYASGARSLRASPQMRAMSQGHVPVPPLPGMTSSAMSSPSAPSSAYGGPGAAGAIATSPGHGPVLSGPQWERHTAELTSCITAFLSPILPTEEEYRIKEATRRQLERLANRVSPGAKLLAFGSMANGFALRNSDMDLCCLTRKPEVKSDDAQPPQQEHTASELVEILGQLIREETDFTVMPLPKARIPIIKINRTKTEGLPYEIACDIGFENRLALENTRLLLSYAMVDPSRLRSLVLFLKVWAKRRKLNSPYTGTLSSYGYTLLVLFFLVHVKRPAVLPNLQRLPPARAMKPEEMELNGNNIYFYDDIATLRKTWTSDNTENVGELLIDFFRYFAKEFGYAKDVISLKSETGILAKETVGWASELCIEDPFQKGYNVSRTVTKDGLYTIRGEFMRASRILTNTRGQKVSVLIAELCEEREDGLSRAPDLPGSLGQRYPYHPANGPGGGVNGGAHYGGARSYRDLYTGPRRFDPSSASGHGGSFAFEQMARGLGQGVAFPPTAAMLAPLSRTQGLSPKPSAPRFGGGSGEVAFSSAQSDSGGYGSPDYARSGVGHASARTSPSFKHAVPSGYPAATGANALEAFAYGAEISFGPEPVHTTRDDLGAISPYQSKDLGVKSKCHLEVFLPYRQVNQHTGILVSVQTFDQLLVTTVSEPILVVAAAHFMQREHNPSSSQYYKIIADILPELLYTNMVDLHSLYEQFLSCLLLLGSLDANKLEGFSSLISNTGTHICVIPLRALLALLLGKEYSLHNSQDRAELEQRISGHWASFTHSYPLKKAVKDHISTDALVCTWLHTAAFQCQKQQEGINLIIPVYTGNPMGTLDQANFTYLGVQCKMKTKVTKLVLSICLSGESAPKMATLEEPTVRMAPGVCSPQYGYCGLEQG
ncbi:hypothetical protein BCV70DRAFT_207404 [Testicularia cyperi]|uniref:polynucleotide adenylyltransferase n=1 Tax=Testicularia cyperi TaxID=1882483 RepID=A0A317XN43_9BASI|nr:hypothetical protein BCV70DRAFT_207404 [Testicularia cyperi]